jgi:hypothetical protein
MATPEPTSRIESEVIRIRALLQGGQFEPALQAAEVLSVEVPENRDVIYMIAVAQRYLQRIPAALATLERLEQLPSELQPPAPGARPLLRGTAPGRAGHRRLSARGQHQPRPAGELAALNGPLQDDRPDGECRDGRRARGKAR